MRRHARAALLAALLSLAWCPTLPTGRSMAPTRRLPSRSSRSSWVHRISNEDSTDTRGPCAGAQLRHHRPMGGRLAGQPGLGLNSRCAGLSGNALLLKGVLREGGGKPGPSVATEFGSCCPVSATNQAPVPAAVIVSQRWSWLTAHFNAQVALTREQHADLPSAPSSRPVRLDFGQAEFFTARLRRSETARTGRRDRAVRDNLVSMSASRGIDDQPLRSPAGVTFGFAACPIDELCARFRAIVKGRGKG